MFPHQRCRCALILLALLAGSAAGADRDGVRLRFNLAAKHDAEVEVTVSGKIVDARTGKGANDALVRGAICVWRHRGPEMFQQCPRQETQTDEEGNYTLRFVTPLTTAGPQKGNDSICVWASLPGFETRPLWVRPHVTPGQASFDDVNIVLRRGKHITGTVVDDGGQPIPGALVRVQNGWSGAWNYFAALGETRTDERGRFELWCSTDTVTVTSKNPWLRVSKQGYGAEYFWNLLEKDSMGTLTVPRGGTIRGKVLDTAGNPVAGCPVLARDFWPNELGQTATNEQGEYELTGIPGEAVLTRFFERKNGANPIADLTNTTIYARQDPGHNLRDVPQYAVTARENETLTGPDLIVGAATSVSGTLVPSRTTDGLQGLMVRLDTSWDYMVEADGEGNFRFPMVRPGKHRLTAYLPNNLRGDRGIGRVEIEVQPGEPLEDVKIPLDLLARARVQFLDADGNPLEGITGAATWTKNGDGFWTEGTASDADGWSVLHLYPTGAQYVRGFDRTGRGLVAEGFEELQPQPGQTIDNLRIAMVPSASIEGHLLGAEDLRANDQQASAFLEYADGVRRRLRLVMDRSGKFRLDEIVPGVARLQIETRSVGKVATSGKPIEIKPGQRVDLGELSFRVLKAYEVSGKLRPSPTFSDLKGFKIRVGLAAWEPMIAADEEGRFVLPDVPEGRHRLTAYLPFNLRTDRGVGHVTIDVEEGDLEDVELPLETLATYHLQIVDETGSPIPDVAAAAWWTADHSGVFTEGTRSDGNGNATLYVYPGGRQYLGAHDWEGDYELKSHQEIEPKTGQVVENVRITMIAKKKTD